MPTYQGNEPYIFISYAHADCGTVLPLIEGLQARGFRVWFDAGIEMGSEWADYIADHLCDSACVLVFLSEASASSHNCRREINFAIDENKEMLVVYLEDLELPRGMRMQLGVLQALFYSRFVSDAAFLDELCASEALAPCLGEPTAAVGNDALPAVSVGRISERGRLLYNMGSHAAAVPMLRHAAEQGDAEAQLYLGICYDRGDGVERDAQQANYWFTQAAEQEVAEAQFMLGASYLDQDGVLRDDRLAARWFARAARQGYVFAQFNLGLCYKKGLGVAQSDEHALQLFTAAAEHGLASAQYQLGVYYETGRGVKRNLVTAKEWYRKAAEQGDEDAKRALARLSLINKL